MRYTILIATIAFGLPGVAAGALPPFNVSQPLPAIVLPDLHPNEPPQDSPATIETALILCACAGGSMAAGATGAGIGSGLGALIGGGLGRAGGPIGAEIGSTIGAGVGGYIGAEIGHAHHRAFGHREASSGSTGSTGTLMVGPDLYMTDGRAHPLK